jgi:hypothetical protein
MTDPLLVNPSLISTLAMRTGLAPEVVYEVKLSNGDRIGGKISVQGPDANYFVITNADGAVYVSITHVVTIAPRTVF